MREIKTYKGFSGQAREWQRIKEKKCLIEEESQIFFWKSYQYVNMFVYWLLMAKKYYYKNNYRRQDSFELEAKLFVVIGILIVFSIAGFYQSYIKPNLESIFFYWTIIVTIFWVLAGYYFYQKYQKRKKLAQMPDFIRELIEDIHSFSPFEYGKEEKEICYQAELWGYLKSKYPQVKFEEERNFVRCDLSVDNIGIEIKWPTTMESLKTLPDKINAYVPVWEYLIIVLFHVKIVDYNEKRNEDAYTVKTQQIKANIPPEKRDKVFFVRIW